MKKEEKELLLKGLRWTDMETLECHCYDCELFDSKNNTCKCIDLCKNPKRTHQGFYTKDRNNKVITLEEKQLLYKDLSSRLSYGVIVEYGCKYEGKDLGEKKSKLTGRMIDSFFENMLIGMTEVYSLKPYLRPMESMTNKESADLYNIYITSKSDSEYIANCTDYLLSHHLDYHNLIPKGLALPAPEEMYNF